MKIFSREMDTLIETVIKPNLKVIYKMRVEGYKDRQIAKYLGITLKHFLSVKDQYEELREVYEDATQLLASKLRNVVIERALGTDGRLDKDGNEVPADANLAFRLLEKIDPEYSKKESEVNVHMTVEHVIAEVSERRQKEVEAIRQRRLEEGYES